MAGENGNGASGAIPEAAPVESATPLEVTAGAARGPRARRGRGARAAASPPPPTEEPSVRARARRAPEPEPEPEELSPLELLASMSEGTVEVDRIGPGAGPGWKLRRGKPTYRGDEVQTGIAGTVANSPGLWSEIERRWGGGEYELRGSIGGRAVRGTRKLPGAPKPLRADDPALDDEAEPGAGEDGEPFGPWGQEAGGHAGIMPATVRPDLGWAFLPGANGWKWLGDGPPPGPPPSLPGNFAQPFDHARIRGRGQSDDEVSALREEITDLRRARQDEGERRELDRRFEKLEGVITRLAEKLAERPDPSGGPLANMLAQQIQLEQIRADREREERGSRLEAERERLAAERAQQQQWLSLQLEAMNKQAESASAAAKDQAQTLMTVLQGGSQTPEKLLALVRGVNEATGSGPRGKAERLSELVMEKATERLLSGASEATSLGEVKEIIKTVGETLSIDVAPAVGEVVASYSGKKDEGRPEAGEAAPTRAQAMTTRAERVAARTDRAALPAPAPKGGTALTPRTWLDLLGYAVEKGYRTGKSPEIMRDAVGAWCDARGIAYADVQKAARATTPAQIASEIGRVMDTVAADLRAKLVMIKQALEEGDGRIWAEKLLRLVGEA